MLKASHWLGIVLGAATILASVLVVSNWETVRYFATNWHELSQGSDWARRLKTADNVLDYIAAHPKDVSLAYWKVGEEKNGIFHEADTLRPLASTVDVLVLVAYGDAIHSGSLSSDEQVPLAEWNALYLPGTDGGGHSRALSDLGRRGRLGNERVSLGDLAMAMIRHGDHAAADYLMRRIGRRGIAETTSRLALEADSGARPFAGQLLSWRSVDHTSDDSLKRLASSSPSDRIELTWALTEKLASDPDFRMKERARLEHEGLGLTIREQETFASTFGNRGSARQYARAMQTIYSNEIAATGEKAWELLEWPMASETVGAKFDTLGAKSGALQGILTSAYYARPKGAATCRVLALFFQNVPMGSWEAMQKSGVQQDFERRLLSDDAFAERVRARLR